MTHCQIPTYRQNASITVVGTMLNRETDSAPGPLPDPPYGPTPNPIGSRGYATQATRHHRQWGKRE